jgi:polyhydroxyalkanoate synthesis repressor PhaR
MQHTLVSLFLAGRVKNKMKNKMKKKPNQPLIIKKYENRRLYNTLTSEYINQGQVAQLVRDGHDLRVIDAATGQNITRLILAQIVLDDAKAPDSVFPLDLLRQMIMASGRATQEGALRYMKSMMEIYQNAYRAFPLPMNPFELIPAGWGQGRSPQNAPGLADNSTGSAQQAASAADAPSKSQSNDNELRRRIEELEKALSVRRRQKKASRSKSRRKS